MSFDAEQLYNLLPAVYRLRDAEAGEPLRALLSVIAGQAVILEDDLAQLYDDLFIETCAPWVIPYLGDLVGARGVQGPGQPGFTPRAEVANTIGYRRRKGTAAMLEQLARDITGWPARAVEFFQLLATTQYLNHLRPENRSFVSVRDADRLERLGGAFEHLPPEVDLPHTAEVRRIASGRGRYNLPSVGLFLWRVRACPLTRAPAVPADASGVRFRFDPLGRDLPLFSQPETEEEVTSLASPQNVPEPIGRRTLNRDLEVYYRPEGEGSLVVEVQSAKTIEPTPLLVSQVAVCDLSEWDKWDQMKPALPPGTVIGIDPVLGRLAFVGPPQERVLVSYHYGFSAQIGGGEYGRIGSLGTGPGKPRRVASVYVPAGTVPAPSATVGSVLGALPAEGGIVEIMDSGRYPEAPAIAATASHIELRAGEKHRPLLAVDAAGTEITITGDEQGEVTLNGLLISGGPVHVSGKLGRLRLRHCTIVPKAGVALIVESASTSVEIERCILAGGLQVDEDARVQISDSIVDAGAESNPAYEGLNGKPGGALRIEASTVIGTVDTAALELASNTLFLAKVTVLRRQEGCVRFSYVAPESQTPRRYRCRPEAEDAVSMHPAFTSLRYGDPGYAQLSARCPDEIRRGAEDESEMGAFHHLFQPQREAYLRARLEEYLRFGLEAGLLFAS